MQALNENWGACDVVMILHELHQRGYEQLRLHCGWSPNGLSWRWIIYPKCLMGKDASGEQHDDYTPLDCPHGSVACIQNDVDYSRAADVLLRSASEFLELGKQPDKEYVRWYAQLVEHAKRGEFPVAFGEYFPSSDSWLFEPSQEKLPYPPFTPTELDYASRLMHCRYYDGKTEPDMDNGFDEYYFAMAEKFYVNDAHKEDMQHCLKLLKSLHLDDLQGNVPLELVAQLYMTCDHLLQKGSWDPCSSEHVAEYFRTKFFPKYLASENEQHSI